MQTPPATPPRLTGAVSAAWGALALRWPGAALCAVVALAASFISGQYGGPQLLYALFLGICFEFLHQDERTRRGIEFCSTSVLRLGVALLGARITVTQIAALGWATTGVIVCAVASTILFGLWLSRRLGLGSVNGVLSGGATAICGASAALALSAVLPRSREQERFTLVVVAAVTALSTVAMLLYPLIARALGLPPALAGLFLGGSIHDVAQVIAAGALMGPAVADQATVVKLLRISLLAFVVMAVSLSRLGARRHADATAKRPPVLPGFLQVFLVLVALHSLGWFPPAWQQSVNDISRGCLVIAISALGVKTSLGRLAGVGWRAFALLLIETAWLAVFMLAAAVVMRR